MRDATIVERLGRWYDREARDLPWRRTRDPYAVWVSEVMLQQTRVETVVPYYRRFLARWPDVHALARADLDEVLSAWSGLGYYRRARVMHLAAREVTERFGGAFPTDVEQLRSLPGVGAYTAGAVASIAGEVRAPLVDGNVARVLSRLEGIEEDPKSAAGARKLWAAAERLVPADRPGRFNQALMELGARVCVPREPGCADCPVRAPCAAATTGRQAELPSASPRRARPRVRVVAAVVIHGRSLLLARRHAAGLFGGLWEPPMVEASSIDEARPALCGAGVDPGVSLEPAGSVRHVLTHREMEVLVVRARVRRRFAPAQAIQATYDRIAWLDPDAADVGVSTLARNVIARARAAGS
jgi:A/G-specific adenine glycosylase